MVSRVPESASPLKTFSLAFGQTYYWRVDEVNAPPESTVFKGDVWSVTVEPYGCPVKPIKVTASSVMTSAMGSEKTACGNPWGRSNIGQSIRW